MLWTPFPSIATHLVAAESHPRVYNAITIDPHRSRLDSARHPHRSRHVFRPDRASKAVVDVIRKPQRLLGIVERNDRHDRSENLFAGYGHVVGHI